MELFALGAVVQLIGRATFRQIDSAPVILAQLIAKFLNDLFIPMDQK
jgi:hypothetical protein